MSIIRKVKAVEKVFDQLERETQIFKSKSGMSCMLGCGQCCTKPDIEACVLEFLPLAWYWFLTGVSAEKRNQLAASDNTICHNFTPGLHFGYLQGSCHNYAFRGMICRLFGFAVTRDKTGKRVLSTCKVLKTNKPDAVAKATTLISDAEEIVPSFQNYYQKLIDIDFYMGQSFYPINTAIVNAIDSVHQYYAYRPFPKKFKKSA